MKCAFCGNNMKKEDVTFVYDECDDYLVVEHVPAEVCTKCGERTYSPEVTDELLKFARKEFKPIKTINVPVFDFSEAGSA